MLEVTMIVNLGSSATVLVIIVKRIPNPAMKIKAISFELNLF